MGPQRVGHDWATEPWMVAVVRVTLRGAAKSQTRLSNGALDGGGCCCSVAQSCPTFCDPTDCSTPGFPVLHYLLRSHLNGFTMLSRRGVDNEFCFRTPGVVSFIKISVQDGYKFPNLGVQRREL